MIEATLVLVKPDGVQRGLIGEIISRFEKRGLKVAALKMVRIDKDFSKEHMQTMLARISITDWKNLLRLLRWLQWLLKGLTQ